MTLFATFANNIVIYLIPFDICFAFFYKHEKNTNSIFIQKVPRTPMFQFKNVFLFKKFKQLYYVY